MFGKTDGGQPVSKLSSPKNSNEGICHYTYPLRRTVGSYLPNSGHTKRAMQLLRELLQDENARFRSQDQLNFCVKMICEDRKDSLVVLPTGSGKTLLYQLPAYALSTTTGKPDNVILVIVPLVSLTFDLLQRTKTCAKERFGTHLWKDRAAVLRNGTGGVLFLSVEVVGDESYLEVVTVLVAQNRLAAIYVEEAHLTVLWKGFRPRMSSLRTGLLPVSDSVHVPIVLLSATIPPALEMAVKSAHGVPLAETWRQCTSRENLSYQVFETRCRKFVSVEETMICETITYIDAVTKNRDASKCTPLNILIMCGTHAIVDKIFDRLRASKVQSTDTGYANTTLSKFLILRHHSGMTDEQRINSCENWTDYTKSAVTQCDGGVVMVCTSGFGTGIDTPSVRLVVHVGGCRSLIEYSQESGRAGRDGFPSSCVVLFNETYCDRYLRTSKKNAVQTDESVDFRTEQFVNIDGFKKWSVCKMFCRRQQLFSIIDGTPPEMCMVSSSEKRSWCDVCLSISKDEKRCNYSLHNDEERGKSVSSEKRLNTGDSTRSPVHPLITADSFSYRQYETQCERGNNSLLLSKEFMPEDVSAMNRSVVGEERVSKKELIVLFREQSQKIFRKCISCLAKNGIDNMHERKDGKDCTSHELRCFRCFTTGHLAVNCPLFSYSSLKDMKESGRRSVCFGCRLDSMDGLRLHTPDRAFFGSQEKCPFSSAIHLCMYICQDENMRRSIDARAGQKLNWPSINNEKGSVLSKTLHEWCTLKSILSERLNVMEVLNVVVGNKQ